MIDRISRLNQRHAERAALILLLFAVVVVAASLTLANYRFAADYAGGNDFVPRWLGTQLLLTQGQNPYSPETSLAIQEFMYGRPARPNEDQVLFAYPLYSALVFAPFALIGDYVLARALWMTTLELALIGLAVLSLSLAKWRPVVPVLALFLLFVLIWYHSVRPLINGNASILVALFIAAALYLIRDRKDIAAGGMLAAATIKPQTVVLLVPLILIWAYSRGRFKLIISTVCFLTAFFVLAMIIQPDWLAQNLRQVIAYPGYTVAGTPADIFETLWPANGRWFGIILSLVLVGLLLWQWRGVWNRSFAVLLPVTILTLSVTNLIGITTAASNFILLLPGLVLLLAYWQRESGRFRDWPAVLAMLLLLAGLWWLFLATRSGRAQSSIMLFPLPMILVVTLPLISRAAIRVECSD